jgi:uncharacterized protein
MSFPAGALQTVPNAGIPAGFRKRANPNGDEKSSGAGLIFTTSDGKALFVKRSAVGDHAGEWCFPGGRVEQDEEPHEAARREALEEIGLLPQWEVAPLHRKTSDEGVDFVTFGQPVDAEFEPTLNDEHDDHIWASLTDPPKPLHPGVAAMLAEFFAEEAQEPKHATDTALKLALDGESVRTVDKDGHLHIAETNVCKACVSPYRGNEIPDWEQLGLEPDRIYQMLRPPEELEKATPSINGKPLLRNHVPVSADDHKEKEVAGSVGTNARWDAPYIKNSLTIWPAEDIEGVESREKYQLSPGYHYRAVMDPGTFDGEPYDGKMVDISFNHVAIVEEGRQGPDVVVGDSALKEKAMKPTRLEYLAVTRAALALNPLLALDQKIELAPIFSGLTTKNIKDRKAKIVGDVKKALVGKTIAKDASVEHLAHLLDQLEHTKEPKSLDESVSENQHKAMEAAAHGHSNLGIPKDVGEEFAEADKGKGFGDMIRDWAKGKDWAGGMSEDDFEHLKKMHEDCKDELPENALDESEEEKAERERKEKEAKDKKAKDEAAAKEEEEKKAKDEKDAKDMKAMDQRLKDMEASTAKAIEAAVTKERQNARETAEAREFVRPYVGELPMALDSAEKVLRSAAQALNIEDADGIHHSALKTIIKMQPKPGTQGSSGDYVAHLATDSAASKGFAERFPDASRIGAV